MKWRILLELTETTGSVQTREMVTGDRPTNVISPEPIGLSLAESKCRITPPTLRRSQRLLRPL